MLDSGQTVKIQVKYATLKKSGIIELGFRTSWADRHGTHMKHYSKNAFDYYAVYCPDKNMIIYIPNSEDCPKVIRFGKTRNNQGKRVKWANEYLEIKRESSETIRHTPETVKT